MSPPAEPELPDPATFLSGEHGHVAGIRRVVGRTAGDRLLDLALSVTGTLSAIDRAGERLPARRVLVVGTYMPERSADVVSAVAELRRTHRHRLTLALGAQGPPAPELESVTAVRDQSGGKFENVNGVLEAAGGAGGHDWILAMDDDVVLPHRFLDRFLALCDGAGLALAQPAQTLRSHAAWRVARRRPGSVLRETRFVEIGPLTAFRSDAAAALLPFPPTRMGWGLDLHWAAVAAERGFRCGIADATPVRHERAPVGGTYSTVDAIEEARRFLSTRSYLSGHAVPDVLHVHRRPPAPGPRQR